MQPAKSTLALVDVAMAIAAFLTTFLEQPVLWFVALALFCVSVLLHVRYDLRLVAREAELAKALYDVLCGVRMGCVSVHSQPLRNAYENGVAILEARERA